MSAADLGQLDRSLVPIQSLSADPTNGCVTSLRTAHMALQVNSWGTEFGDWYGFFSQARMGGTNVRVVDASIDADTCGTEIRAQVDLPRGTWLFEGSDLLEKGVIRRTYRLTALTDSLLGDFVMRWALPASDWPACWVNGQRVPHSGRNCREETTERSLVLTSEARGLMAVGVLTDASLDKGLDLCSYLRDEPSGDWIAHHRLLAPERSASEYILRVWRAVVSSTRLGWVRSPIVRRALWRWSERHPGTLPLTLQVCANAAIRSGTRLVLEGVLRLQSDSTHPWSASI